ncbi:MAG: hypothetical protein KGJ21_06965, partial [Pseudomonadota bacterium]|nr:hypothetical protein [Pseudomonadota bacterium]
FFIPIVLLVVWIGLYPKPYFSAMEASVTNLMSQAESPLPESLERSRAVPPSSRRVGKVKPDSPRILQERNSGNDGKGGR